MTDRPSDDSGRVIKVEHLDAVVTTTGDMDAATWDAIAAMVKAAFAKDAKKKKKQDAELDAESESE